MSSSRSFLNHLFFCSSYTSRRTSTLIKLFDILTAMSTINNQSQRWPIRLRTKTKRKKWLIFRSLWGTKRKHWSSFSFFLFSFYWTKNTIELTLSSINSLCLHWCHFLLLLLLLLSMMMIEVWDCLQTAPDEPKSETVIDQNRLHRSFAVSVEDQRVMNDLTLSTIIRIPSGRFRWTYSRNVSPVEPVKCWN